jgi:cysteine-rich repeat protein
MSKVTRVWLGISFVAVLAHCSCSSEKKDGTYVSAVDAVAKTPSPEATIGGYGFGAGSKGEMGTARGFAEAAMDKPQIASPEDVSSSFFQEASQPCHHVFRAENFTDLAPANINTSSALTCWPSGRCDSFVENVGEPIKVRKVKFGEDTSALEQTFLDKFQELAQQSMKTLTPKLNESERTFVWRDFMADTKEEKDLRDVYKVMSLWSSVTLKWLPCKGESGSACSVQPQVQFAMLAVTPQANSAGDGASCTLFFGVPDETKANGFSKPSNMMRQLKGAIRPALDGEFQKMGVCGDNNIQKKFEECDDGNITPNDGCSADCKIEVK